MLSCNRFVNQTVVFVRHAPGLRRHRLGNRLVLPEMAAPALTGHHELGDLVAVDDVSMY
jgi:hypothetical protein